MTDYDIDLQYHPGKVNIMPDALNGKPKVHGMMQFIQQKKLLKEMMKLNLIVVQRTKASEHLLVFQIQPTLIEDIKEAQKEDPRLHKFKE